jgi:predicted DNA-binding antitoxin AbrB/MazE fold protein
MLSVLAIYEKGVLRPTEPLDLKEGQRVQLSVYPQLPLQSLRSPTPEEEDYARRLKAAKSLTEMFAVMQTAPPSPNDTYDIVAVINESRQLTGFRLPDPQPGSGSLFSGRPSM